MSFKWMVNPEHQTSRFKFLILEDKYPVAQVVGMAHAHRCVTALNEYADHPLSYEGLIKDELYLDGRRRYSDTDDFEVFINPDDYSDEPQPGDVYGSTDVALVLPDGSRWHMGYQEALHVGESLLSMAVSMVTRPWSNDDPSSIITRGAAAEDRQFAQEQATEQGRQILRPVGQTTEGA